MTDDIKVATNPPGRTDDEITEANRRFPLPVQDQFLRRAFLEGCAWEKSKEPEHD